MPTNLKTASIPGYKHYTADTDGNIYCRGVLVEARYSEQDRVMYVTIARGKNYAPRRLPHLILRAFHQRRGKRYVKYLDGNPKNCALENLFASAGFSCNRGVANNRAKLNEDKVRAIRLDRRPLKEIAVDYGIAVATVSAVQNRTRWSYVE